MPPIARLSIAERQSRGVHLQKRRSLFRVARRCAARADREFEPRAEVGDVGALPRARPQGPDDVRPDDRGLVDLHRQPGHRAGHVRDLRRGGPPALRRRPRGPLDPHRGPRRHGRRAAARRELCRRVVADIECQQSRIDFRLRSRYLDEQASDLDDALARIARCTREDEGASRSACSATPPSSCPSCAKRAQAGGIRPDLVTDQTSAHDLVNGYLPRGLDASSSGRPRRPTRRSTPRCSDAAAKSCAEHVQAMLEFQAMGVPTVDYGNNIRQVAFDEGVAERVRLPRLRARLHPAAVLPRQGAVPLGRAVGRSRKTSARPTRR